MTHGPIVVGIDNSDEALAALMWAHAYASTLDCPLVVVHALGLLERPPSGPPTPTQPHRDEILRRYQELVNQHCGSAAHFVARDGEPFDVLRAEAESSDASLVVVGHRGDGRTAAAIGSTSSRLVERAGRPVVVVPNPGRPR